GLRPLRRGLPRVRRGADGGGPPAAPPQRPRHADVLEGDGAGRPPPRPPPRCARGDPGDREGAAPVPRGPALGARRARGAGPPRVGGRAGGDAEGGAGADGARRLGDGGVEVIPGAANFFLMRTPLAPADLVGGLAARSVRVRDVSAYPGLGGDGAAPGWVRVSVGAPAENRAFAVALQHVLSAAGVPAG